MEKALLSQNARTVLAKRYLIRDAEGQPLETPEDLFWRVARYIAEGDFQYGKSEHAVEALANTFYGLMARLEFLPNSPTLMNADRPLGQLSACFVLPVQDSIESIFETLKQAAIIHQSGGGTGFSFSQLRPKDDVVRSTMGVSSGPVSFMGVYNAATEAIRQGGTRRGANMGILRIDHPDIEAFIHCKNDLTQFTNFNISVAVTDAFMEAVDQDLPFDLLHPNTGHPVKTLPARALFEEIVQNAWQTGEPGLIFIDRINAENPTPALGRMESTNPCGEVPLLPYEACNLGSINLGKMIHANGDLDWERLAETVRWATHFLENVITQNRFPIPEIKAMVEGNRKIGLGVMGWADLLIKLGLPYNSEEAFQLAKEVAAWMDFHSKQASLQLAQERGPFPYFKQSRFAQGPWLSMKHAHEPTEKLSQGEWVELENLIHRYGLRNATTTCIAPTGTISIIAGASGGIEPLFGVVFLRNVMDKTQMLEVQPDFEAWANASHVNQEDLMAEIARQGSVAGMAEIPEDIRRVFVTAHDIAPEWHVKMQAAFQAYTDNGVSKTINFPETALPESIAKTYWAAYRLGVKGITVYRHNSRSEQPMALKTKAMADSSHTGGRCPECGAILQAMEGCVLCASCGYSPCF